MTFKDSIEKLIERLVKLTLNGNVTWTQPLIASFNRVETSIDETVFTFYVTWKLELETGWSLQKGWVQIRDETSNFDFTVFHFNFPELMSKLQDYLCEIHFNKLKPSESDIVDIVDMITKKLSIEELRDRNIGIILD